MTALGHHPEVAPELTLELARRSTEPRAADKARNIEALRARLGLPQAPAATPPLTPPALPGAAGTLAAGSAARNASTVLAPWRHWLAVGIVTGTIGFYLGRRFDSPPAVPSTAQAALTLASVAEPPVVAASRVHALEAATGPTATESAVAEPASVTATPPRAVADGAPSSGSSRRRAARKVAAAQAAEQISPDFLQAVQLLGRARRALDRGEPALALALLDEIDARFPRAMLDEERAATRVLGLCASGEHSAASELAQRLFSGRPRSIYSRRIERSCAGAALTPSSQP